MDQQSKEFDLIQANTQRIRILRHDMRMLLNSIALSIQNNDKEHALMLISSFISEIDSTSIIRYCEDDTINYVLSHYASKCNDLNIQYDFDVDGTTYHPDPMFASIVSNALDNAFNAQKELDESKRCIQLMLTKTDHKILFSIRNPYHEAPVFVDGVPISNKKVHGYGTQSIRYLTEKLGGNYQFSLQDNWFVLRIVIPC